MAGERMYPPKTGSGFEARSGKEMAHQPEVEGTMQPTAYMILPPVSKSCFQEIGKSRFIAGFEAGNMLFEDTERIHSIDILLANPLAILINARRWKRFIPGSRFTCPGFS
jgi:hypothetical protein